MPTIKKAKKVVILWSKKQSGEQKPTVSAPSLFNEKREKRPTNLPSIVIHWK
jgi:hypothetical protein